MLKGSWPPHLVGAYAEAKGAQLVTPEKLPYGHEEMTWIYAVGAILLLLVLIAVSVADRNLASVEVVGDDIVIEPRGFNKAWTLRSKLVVPTSEVTEVRVVEDPRTLPRGLRLPGTAVPGLITAGSYLKAGEWSFFAMRGGRPVVVIETTGRYRRIVLETTDPHATVATLTA